jgi:hypothetical protein
LWRLARAETKYDRRIICSAILAFVWVTFWSVAGGDVDIEIARQPESQDAPLTYYFQLGPRG